MRDLNKTFPSMTAHHSPLPKSIIFNTNMCFFKLFQLQGKFYKQTAGTSMGSPLSLVLADIFMEEFETSTLLTDDLQPSLWLHYVDDTFVVWPHGRDALQNFLQYLNAQHPSIKFTMEVGQQDILPQCWHLQETRWLLTQRRVQEAHPY